MTGDELPDDEPAEDAPDPERGWSLVKANLIATAVLGVVLAAGVAAPDSLGVAAAFVSEPRELEHPGGDVGHGRRVSQPLHHLAGDAGTASVVEVREPTGGQVGGHRHAHRVEVALGLEVGVPEQVEAPRDGAAVEVEDVLVGDPIGGLPLLDGVADPPSAPLDDLVGRNAVVGREVVDDTRTDVVAVERQRRPEGGERRRRECGGEPLRGWLGRGSLLERIGMAARNRVVTHRVSIGPGQTAGCCCVAQWMPPPPAATGSMSSATISRPGYCAPMSSAARASADGSPNSGTSTAPLQT